MAGLLDYLTSGDLGGGLFGYALTPGQFSASPYEANNKKIADDSYIPGLLGGASLTPQGLGLGQSPFNNAAPYQPQAMPNSPYDLAGITSAGAPATPAAPSIWDNPKVMNGTAAPATPAAPAAPPIAPPASQQQAELPPAAQPIQYQQPNQRPAFLGGPGSGDIGDRLNAGLQGFLNAGGPLPAIGNLITGLATGQRTDPIGMAQQSQRALYDSLVARGIDPASAVAFIQNPKMLEAVGAQLFGPKQAPSTVKYTDPVGIERTAYWHPQSQQYLDLQTNKPVTQSQPTPGQSSSPYTTSTPPVGVDPKKWREDEAARIADAQKELRTKAEGVMDFVPDALRTLDRIKGGKYDQAIGPIVGSPTYNEYVRGIGGALDPTGTARANLGSYNEFNADIKRLATKNLKAQFGGRVTNIELEQNNKTFGGAQSADPTTASNILTERVRSGFETLQRAAEGGVIDPRSIPPEVVKRGVDMGMLNPKTFGVAASAQPQSSFTQDQLRAEAIRRGLIKQ